MAVTHSKEVTVPQPHDVRVRQVGVLVDLERIVRRNTTLGGKRKLRNDVGQLFCLLLRRRLVVFPAFGLLRFWRLDSQI